jgi:hypothetical protein
MSVEFSIRVYMNEISSRQLSIFDTGNSRESTTLICVSGPFLNFDSSAFNVRAAKN